VDIVQEGRGKEGEWKRREFNLRKENGDLKQKESHVEIVKDESSGTAGKKKKYLKKRKEKRANHYQGIIEKGGSSPDGEGTEVAGRKKKSK